MPFETVVRKTEDYLKIPSVVGFEGPFLRYLAQDFAALGIKATLQKNLLILSGKQPHRHIITAHADRHGLISIGHDRYAYAAALIKKQKYNEDSLMTDKVLNAIRERFVGEDVYAYEPEDGTILARGAILATHDKYDINPDDGAHPSVTFDIDDIDLAEAGVPIAYARRAETNGPLIKGQIDNVLSLALIYVLYQNGYQGTALITTEEEIGKSWLHIKNYFEGQKIETKKLLVLDTSPYREKTPIQNYYVVLRERDKHAPFHADLVKNLVKRCERLTLPYQVKDRYFLSQGLDVDALGSTELGRLVAETQSRWNGATIQIPTTEYHTSFETTSRGCIDNVYRLLSDCLIENPL